MESLVTAAGVRASEIIEKGVLQPGLTANRSREPSSEYAKRGRESLAGGRERLSLGSPDMVAGRSLSPAEGLRTRDLLDQFGKMKTFKEEKVTSRMRELAADAGEGVKKKLEEKESFKPQAKIKMPHEAMGEYYLTCCHFKTSSFCH